MDLHFTNAQATPQERAVIDAQLPLMRDDVPLRSYLLPVLIAIQQRVGWISPGALNYAGKVLGVPPAEAFGVADFYALLSTRPQAPVVAHICDDIACGNRGGEALCAAMEATLGPAGEGQGTTWHRSPCLGLCEHAPAALVMCAGESPQLTALPTATADALRSSLQGINAPALSARASVPQVGNAPIRLLRRIGHVNPASLDDYLALDGFVALRKAITMGPDAVLREVEASKLAGRGGAAFPTGMKWRSVLANPKPRYLVCNADESEPGTFKDRVVMEGDPFTVIESMLIAAFTTGCELGIIYLRGEYPLAHQRLTHAIAECHAQGWLGANILGTDFIFDIELRSGAGAYICGEETAMLNSIEGYRGEPRNKPPFPTQVGLFGKPTVINNVETLINVPHIVLEGGAAFATIGTEKSTGTKLYCVCGDVARPGVYEAAFGITLRELLALAGGVAGNLQAVLLGGAAGGFVTPEQLDTPLTFEGCRDAGATLGSAVVMPFNDQTDLRDVLLRIAAFFRDESCGQCVPCRVGAVRQEELLHRLAKGAPIGDTTRELALLKELGQAMRDASICALGHTASSAAESAMSKFKIFAAH